MTQGKWWSKIDKVWQNWIRWKMPLCKWHTLWMAPYLICYFIVVIFYVERKWLLMRNLSTILPLMSKLSPKFQRFNTLDRFSIKIKNWKTASSKQRAALRKFFSFPPTHPHRIKSYYVSGTKILLRRFIEICRHLLSKRFKNAVLVRQEKKLCSANVVSYAK